MDLLGLGSAIVLEEIKNCGRWSEIVAVILPEIMSFEITLHYIIANKGSGMTCMSTRLNNIWLVGVAG